VCVSLSLSLSLSLFLSLSLSPHQHANGILEIFRKTTLPVSNTPAWKPVHKIASRLSRTSESAERELVLLVDALVAKLADDGQHAAVDISAAISDWYWQVTLPLVLGKHPAGLCSRLYHW
jgi:hypothetical protein